MRTIHAEMLPSDKQNEEKDVVVHVTDDKPRDIFRNTGFATSTLALELLHDQRSVPPSDTYCSCRIQEHCESTPDVEKRLSSVEE